MTSNGESECLDWPMMKSFRTLSLSKSKLTNTGFLAMGRSLYVVGGLGDCRKTRLQLQSVQPWLSALLEQLGERLRAGAPEQRVELHVAADPGRKVLAIRLAQRAPPGAPVLRSDLAVLVPAAIVETFIAVLLGHGRLTSRDSSRPSL